MFARHVIVALLIVGLAAPAARAQEPRVDGSIWRTYVQTLKPNAFVRVRTANGKSMKGRIVQVGDNALRFNPKTRVAVPPREVPYEEIVAIDLAKEPRWNPAVKTLLGVGIGVATFLLFSAIVALSGYD